MTQTPPPRFPHAPLERRAYAYLLDFVLVWLLSSLAGGILEFVIFTAAWFGLRVVVPSVNQGQSLGTWAFDLKVINLRFRRLPGLLELSKREGILGLASFLAMVGFNINFRNGISFLLFIAPLAADCGFALTEDGFKQAFHDRIAETVVIASRRGFSLDLRAKQFVRTLQTQWQNRQRR